jgi:hypothetical protein
MTPIWYFCCGCGPSVRCSVCGATQCGQNFDEANCQGCAKARAASYGTIPWFLDDKQGRRPNKALRKTLSRIERHRRIWRRKHPPVKLKDLLDIID